MNHIFIVFNPNYVNNEDVYKLMKTMAKEPSYQPALIHTLHHNSRSQKPFYIEYWYDKKEGTS